MARWSSEPSGVTALVLSLAVFASGCGGQQSKPTSSPGARKSRGLTLQEDCPGGGKRSGYWPTRIVGDGDVLWSGCISEKDEKRMRVGRWSLKDDGGRDRGFVTFDGGKLDGPHELRSKEGRRVLSGSYAAGERTGDWTWFGVDGKASRKAMFEHDREVAKLECPPGSLPTSGEAEGEMAEGAPPPSERWCEDAEGMRQGPFLRWHEKGLLAERVYFKDDIANGPFEKFDEQGRLSVRGATLEGDFDGLVEEWHETGVLAARMTYVGGEFAGKREEWDETGVLILSIEYQDGQPRTAILSCDDWFARARQFARDIYYRAEYSGEYDPIASPPEGPEASEEVDPSVTLASVLEEGDPVFRLGFDVSVQAAQDGTVYFLLVGKKGTQLEGGSWRALGGDLEPVHAACQAPEGAK